jgi:hypothetical protein
MHRIHLTYKLFICVLVTIFLNSCSKDIGSGLNVDDSDTGIPVTFTASIDKKISSRFAASDVMTEFYVYAFSGSSTKARNIKYTWDGSGWVSTGRVNWPRNEISFYGLSRSFANGDEISNSNMSDEEQYFDYTVSPDNPKNLFFASKLNTTSSAQGGNVHLDFVYALAYPYFTCVQGIDDVRIIINEIIVHNLKTTGTLTFSTTNDSEAKWTLVDGSYGDYKQVLETPVELNPNQRTAVTISQPWIWMPQRPDGWETEPGAPVTIQEADALHQCYVEIKCQIIKDGNYLWGAASGENEYESVYYPFDTNFRARGYQRAIKLSFTGGYLEDGTPWKPRSGAAITIASWITIDTLVNPWEEMDPEDLIF